MKCFERLVLAHLEYCLPPPLDPHQFAYCGSMSTEDAICTVLHSVLTHMDNNNTNVRMLFVDFSSTFNTVIPSKLTTKLGNLGINTSLCNWIMDFLTNRPQHVRSDHTCFTTITLNTGIPQGCVLSLCMDPTPSSSFSDDTTVIGLIRDNDKTAYWAAWCADNNLLLNTKTKELIVDFRK